MAERFKGNVLPITGGESGIGLARVRLQKGAVAQTATSKFDQ